MSRYGRRYGANRRRLTNTRFIDGETGDFINYSMPLEETIDGVTDLPIPYGKRVYRRGVAVERGGDGDEDPIPPPIIFTYDPAKGFQAKPAGSYDETHSV